MYKAQITLSVPMGKRLIAKAIAALPDVKKALREGNILLKGGTTVSAVSEELIGSSLRVSGRITLRGTVSCNKNILTYPHSILIHKGEAQNVDSCLPQVVSEMRSSDIAVCGANLIDAHRRAAMMAGSPLGGAPGQIVSTLEAEGITTYIAVGLEKFAPCSLDDAILECGRKKIDTSMGMSVGLIPIPGRLISEIEALSILAHVRACVIGRGGIRGGEGSTTFVISGEKPEVEKILHLISTLLMVSESGVEESLNECSSGGPGCKTHLGCWYRNCLMKG
ncbi:MULTISPECIES: hypothetical protein [Aminobacterium]|jgi:hypothetical protein|uniref:hypothetical protein n=2 Tax=Aminobacterium TaxID=81466 RepID=UPI00257F1C61|nr:hypothetical protein [Aminobacterium sp. UBA5277]